MVALQPIKTLVKKSYNPKFDVQELVLKTSQDYLEVVSYQQAYENQGWLLTDISQSSNGVYTLVFVKQKD